MKRIFALILTLSMLLAICPLGALSAFAETTSGTCGDNLTWSFDSETGTLTILGEGEMEDYGYYYGQPWYYFDVYAVVVEEGVTSIGDWAFYGRYSLTSITIPDSVTSIGAYAFGGCYSLETITVDSNNSVYYSAGNCIIEKESETLILGCKNSVIPDSVTSIGDYAFYYCYSLTSIIIPDSVTSIGEGAFYDCESLTSITIPDSVTSIGDWAFSSCDSLTSIIIPDSVTSIGSSAFSYCESLTSIIIPDSVTSIGEGAFSGCDSLTSINIPDSVTSIGKYAFSYCESLTDVYYYGSEEEWNAISIGDYNDELLNAEIVFNYCPHEKGEWNVLEDGTKEKVCTECGEVLETLGADERIPNDINGDDKFNVFDYISVKNGVMKGTEDEELLVYLDVNGDGRINMFDYVAIKAAYFA